MKTTTLSDTIFEQLQGEIITGALKRGEPILEQGIAQRFGISKATAREILQRLCSAQYLASFPRKGYLIQEITQAQCKQIQQVRYQIEAFAQREVIRRCSDQQILSLGEILGQEADGNDPYATVNSRFHLGIARLSGSPYAYDALHGYMGLICRYALTNASLGGFGVEDSRHQAILAALLARDQAAALENLRVDLHLSQDEI